ADTSTGLSQNLWNKGGGCPREQIRSGYTRGNYFHTDYTDIPLPGTQTTEISAPGLPLKWFNTGAVKNIGVSVVNSVEMAGGFLSSPTDTDNDSSSFAMASPNFFLSGSEDTSGKLW